MLLPICPVCLTNENLTVDTIRRVDGENAREYGTTSSLVIYHCRQDGFKGARTVELASR